MLLYPPALAAHQSPSELLEEQERRVDVFLIVYVISLFMAALSGRDSGGFVCPWSGLTLTMEDSNVDEEVESHKTHDYEYDYGVDFETTTVCWFAPDILSHPDIRVIIVGRLQRLVYRSAPGSDRACHDLSRVTFLESLARKHASGGIPADRRAVLGARAPRMPEAIPRLCQARGGFALRFRRPGRSNPSSRRTLIRHGCQPCRRHPSGKCLSRLLVHVLTILQESQIYSAQRQLESRTGRAHR
jgi:hypothetical protein